MRVTSDRRPTPERPTSKCLCSVVQTRRGRCTQDDAFLEQVNGHIFHLTLVRLEALFVYFLVVVHRYSSEVS